MSAAAPPIGLASPFWDGFAAEPEPPHFRINAEELPQEGEPRKEPAPIRAV